MSDSIGTRHERIDVEHDNDDTVHVQADEIASGLHSGTTIGSNGAVVCSPNSHNTDSYNAVSSTMTPQSSAATLTTSATATATTTATAIDIATTRARRLPPPTKEKNIFLLPNGEIMNAKNTLQSFVVATNAVAVSTSPIIPKNRAASTTLATAAAVVVETNLHRKHLPPAATAAAIDDVSRSPLQLHNSMAMVNADLVEPLPYLNLPPPPPPPSSPQDQVPSPSRWTKRWVYIHIACFTIIGSAVSATAVYCGTGNCTPSHPPLPSNTTTTLTVTPTLTPSRSTSQPLVNRSTASPTKMTFNNTSMIPLTPTAPTTPSPTASATTTTTTALPTINSIPTATPTILPMAPPPQQLSKEEVMTIYSNRITLSGQNISIEGDRTAEDAALRWMVQNDPIFSDTDAWSSLLSTTTVVVEQFRFQQRFALLTLWYQQMHVNGVVVQKTWVNDQGWLNEINECLWFGILCTGRNLDGIGFQDVVTDLVFYNLTILNGNNVTGRLPADLGLLTHLQNFNVRENALFATLPSTIGRWTALTFFDINANTFSGTLPATIGQWSSLAHFDIGDNALTGTLPSMIGQWTALTHFDVSINTLNGTVPASIGNWSVIEMVFLNRNQFTGTVPSEICNFSPKLWIDCAIRGTIICFTQCD